MLRMSDFGTVEPVFKDCRVNHKMLSEQVVAGGRFNYIDILPPSDELPGLCGPS